MPKPADIRLNLIKPNASELGQFGILVPRTINTGKRGRPGMAYYLNEEQALLICLLSKTEKAKQVRAEVIRVFTAWRRGELVKAQPAMPDFTQPVLAALGLPCWGLAMFGSAASSAA